MSTYQGQNVTASRKAQQGDAGFDASKDQVCITLADGSTRVVNRNDVTNP